MRNSLLIFLISLFGFFAQGQELNCKVDVVVDAKLDINSVDPEIFKQLKQTVFELMNNTQWTKDKFAIEERINCNVVIQIKEAPTEGVYKGAIQIQSTRPAFNSSYNTTVFNFQDEDVTFRYSRNTQILYAPNQYRDDLTSILAFYAYFIIGMDYDSFSMKGGSQYFSEAQNIVLNAQAASGPGWKSSESGKRNRYWLVDNALHQLFEPLRECNYEYHRLGIDNLYTSVEDSRKAIYASLSKLNKVVATRPNSVNLLNFVQAKSTELKNLYAEAEPKEKQDLVTLMQRIDPANASKYEEILR
jgi:hypothetical protein